MKRKPNKKSILFLILSILWMCVIFFFSTQPAVESGNISGKLTQWIIELLGRIFNGRIPEFLSGVIFASDHYVRKSGHFIEYFILGVLWLNTLSSFSIRRTVLFGILICALYAASDEIHQFFVPGRGPMVTDVLLDSTAAALGIVITRFLSRRSSINV